MPITGFSFDSTSNGVGVIATAKTGLSGATIDSETVIINNGRLIGGVDITSSHLFLINSLQTNGAANSINIGPSTISYQATTPLFRVRQQSSIMFDTFNRTNEAAVSVSELSDCIITERINTTSRIFVYINPGGVLNNAQIKRIRTLEFSGAVQLFSNVRLLETQIGITNWRGGRIDILGFDCPSTTSGYTGLLGPDNNGNNSFHFWNPVANNLSSYAIMTTNGGLFSGFTVAWQFKDLLNANIQNVLVVYRDNRSGTQAELGRYTTDASGLLVGTYDSQFGTTGVNQSRPVLYVLTAQRQFTGGTRSGHPFNVTEQNYSIAPVSAAIEVRSYLHLENEVFASPNSEIGKINANGTPSFYAPFVLRPDPGVTQASATTVGAYIGIAHSTIALTLATNTLTINQIYDSRKLYWRNTDGITAPVRSGDLALLNCNVTINSGGGITLGTAYSAWRANNITLGTAGNYGAGRAPADLAGGTVTVASGTTNLVGWVFSGTTINVSTGSATVVVDGSQIANITAGANVTIAQSCVLTLIGLVAGSNVAIFDNTGAVVQSANAAGTTFAFNEIIFTSVQTYTYKVTRYGRQDVGGSFALASGGVSIAVAQPIDAFITQANPATVAGYANISVAYSPRRLTVGARTQAEIYDFLRYTDTLLANISQSGLVATINGTDLTLFAGLLLTGIPTGSGLLALGAGYNAQLQSAINYTGLRVGISSTGRAIVTSGTTTLNWDFTTGSQIDNSSSSAAIVTVAADELSSVTASSPTAGGGSVSIQSPPVTFTAANLTSSTFNNVRCRLSLIAGSSPVTIEASSSGRSSGGINFTTSNVNTTANTITLAGINGKVNSTTVIRFYGSDLPQPLDSRAVYYPSSSYTSGNAMSISGTPGGAPIDLIDVGSGTDMYADLWTELDIQLLTSGSYIVSLNSAASSKGVTLATGDTLVLQAVHWAGAPQAVVPAIASEYLEESFLYQGLNLSTLRVLTIASLHNEFCQVRAKDGSQVTDFILDPSTPGKIQLDSNVTSFRSDEAALFFYWVRSTNIGLRLLKDNIQIRNPNDILVVGQLTIDSAVRAVCTGPFLSRADKGFITAAESAQIEYQWNSTLGLVIREKVPVELSPDIVVALTSILALLSSQEASVGGGGGGATITEIRAALAIVESNLAVWNSI